VVCTVVPHDGGCVVLCGRADEVVEVLPARCCFRVYKRGVPLANNERDVCEVSADGGEVGFQGGLVCVGAPGCFSPGGEDEVIYLMLDRNNQRRNVMGTYRESSNGTEEPMDS
jgi:hypothetical protein